MAIDSVFGERTAMPQFKILCLQLMYEHMSLTCGLYNNSDGNNIKNSL